MLVTISSTARELGAGAGFPGIPPCPGFKSRRNRVERLSITYTRTMSRAHMHKAQARVLWAETDVALAVAAPKYTILAPQEKSENLAKLAVCGLHRLSTVRSTSAQLTTHPLSLLFFLFLPIDPPGWTRGVEDGIITPEIPSPADVSKEYLCPMGKKRRGNGTNMMSTWEVP